jgi:hypothetical protein
MCTLAIYFKAARGWPVVVAANRDEYLERPAAAPLTLSETPHIVGGKDLKAGGTWLGINEHGLVAGLLNRRSEFPPNSDARSRGLLCLDVLRRRTTAEALAYLRTQRAADYNPFNLLIASRDEAAVAYNRAGTIELATLTPGLHLLTNLDLDDFECPRIGRSYGRFAGLGESAEFVNDPVAMRAQLGALLADHVTQLDPRNGRPNGLCLHLGEYGTRSSSLIFMGDAGRIEHFFAPGPPCATPYECAAMPRQGLR